MELQKQRQMQQDPSLTFKPKTNSRRPPMSLEEQSDAQRETCTKLYAQGENYWRKKFDRELDTVEWSKNPNEFTFKPEILGNKRAGKVMPLFSEIKEMITSQNNPHKLKPVQADESSVEFERDMEDQQPVQVEDMDHNHAPSAGPQESSEEEDPVSVFIDIALGNTKHRITLRADSDVAAVARDFAREHSLDSSLQLKLQEQLKQSIK